MADCPIEPDDMHPRDGMLKTSSDCLDEARPHRKVGDVEITSAEFETQRTSSPRFYINEKNMLDRYQYLSQKSAIDSEGEVVNTESITSLYRDIVDRNYTNDYDILQKAFLVAMRHWRSAAPSASRSGREDMFDALLSAGAHESAALMLMEPGFSYTVSHLSTRCFHASVVIPGTDRDISAEGVTFASALVAAYLGALVAT